MIHKHPRESAHDGQNPWHEEPQKLHADAAPSAPSSSHTAPGGHDSEPARQAQSSLFGSMFGGEHAATAPHAVQAGGHGHEPHMAPLHNTTLFAKGHGDKNAISLNDIKQQQLGDCFFLSAMGAELRSHPDLIKNMIHEHHGKNGPSWTVDFEEKQANGQYKDTPVTVGNRFPTRDRHGDLERADLSGDKDKHGRNEIWPQVMEAAYAKLHGGYGKLDKGGLPGQAMSELTGHDSTYEQPGHVGAGELQKDLRHGDGMTFSTKNESDRKLGYNLVGSHAYSVKKIVTDPHGKQWVYLNNPWGMHQPKPIPYDAVKHSFDDIEVC